jgi:hypothetical protein
MSKKHETWVWRLLPILVALTMLITVVLCTVPMPAVQAADTGWQSPSVDEADETTGDGDGFEDHPEGAYTSGGNYAANWDGYDDRHLYYGFGLDSPMIPAGADITGIEVRLEGWVDSASNNPRYDVDLSWDGGSSWSSEVYSTQVLTDSQGTSYVLGGASDLWGHGWTVSELSDANFRVQITSRASGSNCGDRDFFLDWVAVRVTYDSAHIGGVIWSDVDADGVQSGAEAGLGDVRVTIYQDDGDGDFEGGDQDAQVGSGDTGADGVYDTGPFPDGYGYWIDVDVPADHYLTTPPEPRLVGLPDGNSIAVNFGYAPLNPAIEIAKTPGIQTVRINSPVTFTITVTNTGDVGLSGVTVTDAQAPDCDRDIGNLAVDAVQGYTCVVEDVTVGFTNRATTEGIDPIGGLVSASDTAVVVVIEPDIAIVKEADQTVVIGSDADFTITVTNTGDVDLSGVTVTDARAPDCDRDIGNLAVDAVQGYTCVVEDVTDGFINSAIVVGMPPVGEPVTDADAATVRLDETLTCPTDMVAYWRLDEDGATTYDDFYDGHDGMCAGDCPTPSTGHVDGGQVFNGSSTGIDAASVPGDDSFNWGADDSFSVEFWMKADSPNSCSLSNEVVVGRDGGLSSQLHWWTGIGCRAGGKAAFVLRDNAGDIEGVESTTVVTDGLWHHIVAVRDGSTNEIRVYVDGMEEGSESATYSAGFESQTAALNIGWLDLSHGYHFAGIVDEVALFDRGLSSDEIRQHYNEGVAGRWYCEAGTFAPIIVSTPVTEAVSGRPYVYDVEAVGEPVPTYTLVAKPNGMTIDSATGLISWTPTVAQERSHEVKVQASNSEGIVTQSFTVVVHEGTICPNGMIAYWKLDETNGTAYSDFYDGHAGECAGDCPTPTMGHLGGGQEFDSDSTGIDVPVSLGDDSFNWGADDSFSVEFWMKADSPNSCSLGNEVAVGRDGGLSGQLHWWAGIECEAGGSAAFVLRDNAGDIGGVESTTVVTDGLWHHIVAVRDDSTNEIRIYVDGRGEGSESATYSAGFESQTAALNIGWLDLSHGYHFAGIVDEVALYDRALSLDEIRQHYDEGGTGPGYCINPNIAVDKAASPMVVYLDNKVTYTYTVTNPGDAPLSITVPSDDKCGPVTFVGGDDGSGRLDPTETWTYQCVMYPRVDVTNTVIVTGVHPLDTVSDTDKISVDVIAPDIAIDKRADPTSVYAGHTVTYTYTVANPGDDPLSDMRVSDDKCGSVNPVGGDDNENYELDPGEIWTYTCSTILNADTTNTATVTGTDSAGGTVTATATAFVDVLNSNGHWIFLPMVLKSKN